MKIYEPFEIFDATNALLFFLGHKIIELTLQHMFQLTKNRLCGEDICVNKYWRIKIPLSKLV